MHSEFASRVPKGSVLYRTPELPIGRLQPIALKTLKALQAFSPAPQKVRIVEDWLDHDGLEFPKGVQPLAYLFSIAATPHSLFQATPKDHRVFLRAEAEDGSWIFRVLTDGDENDREQVGEIQLVVAAEFTPRIEKALVSEVRDGSLQRATEEPDNRTADNSRADS
jgi:hypothetical protein